MELTPPRPDCSACAGDLLTRLVVRLTSALSWSIWGSKEVAACKERSYAVWLAVSISYLGPQKRDLRINYSKSSFLLLLNQADSTTKHHL